MGLKACLALELMSVKQRREVLFAWFSFFLQIALAPLQDQAFTSKDQAPAS